MEHPTCWTYGYNIVGYVWPVLNAHNVNNTAAPLIIINNSYKSTSISRIAMNRCLLVCKSPGVQNNRKAIGENLRATFNLLLNNCQWLQMKIIPWGDSLEDRRLDDKRFYYLLRNKRKTSLYKVKRTSHPCNHKEVLYTVEKTG